MSPAEAMILIVEDNPNDAELALRALGSAGLSDQVAVLEDGAAALELMLGPGGPPAGEAIRKPKVILLDLKLPKIDGLEVLRRLKEDERTRAIPVVVLTSSAERRDMLHSYASGVNSYIVKPVDYESFSRAVADLASYWVRLNRTLP